MTDTDSTDGDDAYIYELTSTLSPGCDFHHCDLAADRLYMGLTIEADTAWTYSAMYCDEHAEGFAELDPNKTLLGRITGMHRA